MIRALPAAFRAVLAIAAIALGASGAASGAELRAFDATSVDAIRAAHAGQPFVLAFWATQCAPCREEMALWKTLLRKHPGLKVVLVATDPPGQDDLIERFLARYDPGAVERWAFADEFSERLRYSVDRAWRGELPRTYFFEADHRAEARSGALDRSWIEAWISRQSKVAGKPWNAQRDELERMPSRIKQ